MNNEKNPWQIRFERERKARKENEKNPWQIRFERERKARKESEALLEQKSFELWKINQDLEEQVNERTESLKKALINAEKADSAKSDFLANISHEIRTPLNAIIGFSQFLAKSDNLNENNSKYASIIETSANSLLSIINDILDFSKIESGKFEVSKDNTDIYDICDSVVELFSQKAAEKNITFVYNMDKRIPKHIITDGIRIRQVISNLISNAVKFTPKEGSIEFNVLLIKKDKTKASIEFEIKDNGIGIPEDKIDFILKPFIQLEQISNKKNAGTGLGLSICNSILNLLDSKLFITSNIGKETSFKFSINADISQNNFVKEKKIYNQNKLQGKILLAEDNIANQELMKLILVDMNIDYVIANNGKELIDFYKNNPSFDLILMDINMPILNGIDAFHKIREYEKNNLLEETPVVALTANAIKGDKEKFISLGMNDYLSKPIEVQEFKNIASKYLTIKPEQDSIQKEKTIKTKQSFDLLKITKRIGISENIANIIIAKFKKEILNDLQELEKYILNKDIKQISQKAHYIKSSCLNLALDDICEDLKKLEDESIEENEKERVFLNINNSINNLI